MESEYPMQQVNGQKIVGPHPNFRHFTPVKGSEVFVGKLPREISENELLSIFSTAGTVYQLRLMIDFSKSNRGFAFVTYVNISSVDIAIAKLDQYEIKPNHRIGVCRSADNCRLLIEEIPRSLSRKEIWDTFSKYTANLKDVTASPATGDFSTNRGFVYLEYVDHVSAANARRQLFTCKRQLWNTDLRIDWAETKIFAVNKSEKKSLDPAIIKYYEGLKEPYLAVFVQNLPLCITKRKIKMLFSFNDLCVTKVKKMGTSAFIHFSEEFELQTILTNMTRIIMDCDIKISSAVSLERFIQPQDCNNSASNEYCQQSEIYTQDASTTLNNSFSTSSWTPANTETSVTQKYLKLFTAVCHQKGWKHSKYEYFFYQPTPDVPGQYRCKLSVQSFTVVESAPTAEEAQSRAAQQMLKQLGVIKMSDGMPFNLDLDVFMSPNIDDVDIGLHNLSISNRKAAQDGPDFVMNNYAPNSGISASGTGVFGGGVTHKNQSPRNDTDIAQRSGYTSAGNAKSNFPFSASSTSDTKSFHPRTSFKSPTTTFQDNGSRSRKAQAYQSSNRSRDAFFPVVEHKFPQSDEHSPEVDLSPLNLRYMSPASSQSDIVRKDKNPDFATIRRDRDKKRGASYQWSNTGPRVATGYARNNFLHHDSSDFHSMDLPTIADLKYDATQKAWLKPTSQFQADNSSRVATGSAESTFLPGFGPTHLRTISDIADLKYDATQKVWSKRTSQADNSACSARSRHHDSSDFGFRRLPTISDLKLDATKNACSKPTSQFQADNRDALNAYRPGFDKRSSKGNF